MKPSGIDPTIGTVAMLATIALVAGGVYKLRQGDRQKGLLMLVCALVLVGNLLIWVIPV
jgi:hypothetical protein